MSHVTSREPAFQVIEGQYGRVRVRKQDIIVLQFQKDLTPGEKSEAFAAMEAYFPGNKVLLLDGGTTMSVFSCVPKDDDDRLNELDEIEE